MKAHNNHLILVPEEVDQAVFGDVIVLFHSLIYIIKSPLCVMLFLHLLIDKIKLCNLKKKAKNRNYFIISAGIIPCLINIARVAIASSISIESIPMSPILKSTFGASLLKSFLPSSEYPIVR